MVSSLACLRDEPYVDGGKTEPAQGDIRVYTLGTPQSYDTNTDGLSAICLNEAGDALLIAQDGGDILEYNFDGTLRKKTTMPNPDGRSKVDLEGIARSVDKTAIYLCEERFREVYSLNADHQGFQLLSVGPIEDGHEDNQGYEGIAAGPDGILYVANQSKPLRVYTYKLSTQEWGTAFDAAWATSLSDIFYDAEDNSLWITDAKTQKLTQLSLSGTVLQNIDISFVSKPEGFCKDPERKLFWFVCDKTKKIFKVSYR